MTKRANGEGTIYRRGDGRWCAAMWHDDPVSGQRRRAFLYGKTRTEVRQKLKAAELRAEEGAPVRDNNATVAKWIREWGQGALKASSRKASTQALYRGLARTHLEAAPFGDITLDKLRPSHVDRLIVTLRGKRLSEATVRQIYGILRVSLDDAVRDGLLARNPAAAVKRPTITKREARYLTSVEVASLLKAAENTRYHDALALIAQTGLRRGEALALRWDDIDFSAATLRVRGTLSRVDGELVVTPPKTEKSRRTLPLSPAAVSLLHRVRTRQRVERVRAGNQWDGNRHVFTTELGSAVDPRNVLRALRTAADAAGLVGVGIHTLRHSAATAMLEQGVNLKVVSEALGHSSIAITGDVYAHVSENALRDAMNRLSEAIGQ